MGILGLALHTLNRPPRIARSQLVSTAVVNPDDAQAAAARDQGPQRIDLANKYAGNRPLKVAWTIL